MLYPRGSLAVTALGDSLYAIGGFDSKEALNVVEVMDTRTMKWRSLQPLSAERAYGEATVVDDQVIAKPHDAKCSLEQQQPLFWTANSMVAFSSLAHRMLCTFCWLSAGLDSLESAYPKVNVNVWNRKHLITNTLVYLHWTSLDHASV